MSDRPTCEVCKALVADGAPVCSRCWDAFEVDLGDVTAYSGELDLTLSRQASTGSRVGARSSTRALPFDLRAADLAHQLKAVLAGWARLVAFDRSEDIAAFLEPEDDGTPVPVLVTLDCADDTPSIARWLLNHSQWLRHHPAAKDAHDELTEVMAKVRSCIDRRPDRVYAGPCGAPTPVGKCDQTLYGKPKAPMVTCQACGTAYDVKERRDAMLDSLADRLVTAGEGARLMAYFGLRDDRERTRNLLTQWDRRGLLLAHGTSLDGHPLYLFADVRTKILAAAQKQAARTAKEAS